MSRQIYGERSSYAIAHAHAVPNFKFTILNLRCNGLSPRTRRLFPSSEKAEQRDPVSHYVPWISDLKGPDGLRKVARPEYLCHKRAWEARCSLSD